MNGNSCAAAQSLPNVGTRTDSTRKMPSTEAPGIVRFLKQP